MADLRRTVMRVFLVSIAVNALLGIWALLVDDFGTTQGKILGTSFLVSAAMLTVLVNGAPVRDRVLWPVPVVAIGAGVAAFGLFIVFVWAEVDAEIPLKLAFSLLVVAGAGTLAALLALVDLPTTYERLQIVAHGLIALLAATVVFAIWAEVDADWIARLIGVESVLVAAMTLAIPVLGRFSPREEPSMAQQPAPRPQVVTPTRSVRFCPVCGTALPIPLEPAELIAGATIRCERCHAELVVSAPRIGVSDPVG